MTDMTRHQISTRVLQMVAGASVVALCSVAAAPALAQSCHELWVERNGYYKDAGYCFKTRRAISYFGNGGCRYDYEGDLPLSREARARIAEIRAMERRFGCD
jgi:hypothetical protein